MLQYSWCPFETEEMSSNRIWKIAWRHFWYSARLLKGVKGTENGAGLLSILLINNYEICDYNGTLSVAVSCKYTSSKGECSGRSDCLVSLLMRPQKRIFQFFQNDSCSITLRYIVGFRKCPWDVSWEENVTERLWQKRYITQEGSPSYRSYGMLGWHLAVLLSSLWMILERYLFYTSFGPSRQLFHANLLLFWNVTSNSAESIHESGRLQMRLPSVPIGPDMMTRLVYIIYITMAFDSSHSKVEWNVIATIF
jgi:hypothetical protein